jgi:arginine decarboxylase
MFVPKKLFLTRGVGEHHEELQSFELALRKAKIAQLNLAQISSIYPPKCELISREKGLQLLYPDQITFCVMARASSNEPGVKWPDPSAWHARSTNVLTDT